MKKQILFCITAVCLMMACTACGLLPESETAEKKHYYEVMDSEGTVMRTITEETALDILDQVFGDVVDSDPVSLPGDAAPLMGLVCYQEVTLLAGQDPEEEREYEAIEQIILYEDPAYVTVVISPSVVKNMSLPEGLLTLTYPLPEDSAEILTEVLAAD